jgi:hypothetical protein
MLLIWIIMEEELAVTKAGVSTVNVRPLSESVDVADAVLSIRVDVATVGALPPGHPVVVNVDAVEVAVFPVASRETAL